MNKKLLTLAVAAGVALVGMASAQAAELVPVVFDDANEGYNDPAPLAPQGGNPGTTVGQQRRIAAQFAADLWGAILVSDEPVYVGALFDVLAPNVLGSAGATYVFRDFDGAKYPNTWYSAALAESITGGDMTEGDIDIISRFSSTFGFYYGLDGNTPAGLTNFLDVVMHEFGHGLGFQNFATEATGQFFDNRPDVYSQFTYDNTQQLLWTQMTTDAQRQQSAINNGNVVFVGPTAVAAAGIVLDNRVLFNVTAPSSIAGTYGYGTAGFGPAATPANFHGDVVVGLDEAIPTTSPTTTDGCTPLTNAAQVAGKIAIMDRGTCGFTVKVKNAQNAGAIGVIIANNAAGAAPGLGGADPTITIPTISVTQTDGAMIKGNNGVQVALQTDFAHLQGADDAGRPRLFMPNPVQGGSSGSHYDSVAAPNLLMEPAINDSLHGALFIDMSAALLEDTGWKINKGNAKIAGCDTGIKVIDDAGFIIGANVEATSKLFLATSPDKKTYQARMSAYKDSLVAAGLITGKQGGKMMTCSSKTGPTP